MWLDGVRLRCTVGQHVLLPAWRWEALRRSYVRGGCLGWFHEVCQAQSVAPLAQMFSPIVVASCRFGHSICPLFHVGCAFRCITPGGLPRAPRAPFFSVCVWHFVSCSGPLGQDSHWHCTLYVNLRPWVVCNTYVADPNSVDASAIVGNICFQCFGGFVRGNRKFGWKRWDLYGLLVLRIGAHNNMA